VVPDICVPILGLIYESENALCVSHFQTSNFWDLVSETKHLSDFREYQYNNYLQKPVDQARILWKSAQQEP
jgi:hypothetical protein